ncbi:MAG: DUF2877 domain-containing protein [Anaerolineae bacterium]
MSAESAGCRYPTGTPLTQYVVGASGECEPHHLRIPLELNEEGSHLNSQHPGPTAQPRWPCLFSTTIRSVSIPAARALQGHAERVRPLGHFDRVINVVIDDAIIAIATTSVGNGPFHVVVDKLPPRLPAGSSLWREGSAIRIGPWSLQMGPDTVVWDPRPAWCDIDLRNDLVDRLRERVRTTMLRRRDGPWSVALTTSTLITATDLLEAALESGGAHRLNRASGALAGLGPGLTPSGDDILAGVLVAMWAAGYARRTIVSEAILSGATGRTTQLSLAFLKAAALGYVDERWHRLLASLSGSPADDLDAAVDRIMDFGASSGLDMLYGFVRGYAAVGRTS